MRKRRYKKLLKKKVTFQLQDSLGNILESNTIEIGCDDSLIMEYDLEKMSIEMASEIFYSLNEQLQTNSPLFAYPKGIILKVLKK